MAHIEHKGGDAGKPVLRNGARTGGRPRRQGELVKVSLLLDPDIPEQRAVLDCLAKLPRARRQEWLRQSVIFGTIERARLLGDITAPLEFNRPGDADSRSAPPAWARRTGIAQAAPVNTADIIASTTVHGAAPGGSLVRPATPMEIAPAPAAPQPAPQIAHQQPAPVMPAPQQRLRDLAPPKDNTATGLIGMFDEDEE